MTIVLYGFLASLAEGVMTGVGGLGVFFVRKLEPRLEDVMLSAAGGIMLAAIGHSRRDAFLVAFATGLVEPVGGLIGAAAVWLVQPLMPWFLGFAAGAMLFIISHEIIPETHRRGFETHATFALMFGFVVMMFLDATLG